MFFDTDCAAVVHNIAYLRFIETARTLLAGQLGWSLAEMAQSRRYPVVVRTEIDYKRPAVLGDILAVDGWLERGRTHPFLVRVHDYSALRWCAFDPLPADAGAGADARGPANPATRRMADPFRASKRQPTVRRGQPRPDARRTGALKLFVWVPSDGSVQRGMVPERWMATSGRHGQGGLSPHGARRSPSTLELIRLTEPSRAPRRPRTSSFAPCPARAIRWRSPSVWRAFPRASLRRSIPGIHADDSG